MPNGGRLRLAAASAAVGSSSLVEDTGVGIPPEQLGRIFELYFTTKESGSGIGLSMVYRTVQLHDGDIEVAVRAGKGDDVSADAASRPSRTRAPTPSQILGLSHNRRASAGS